MATRAKVKVRRRGMVLRLNTQVLFFLSLPSVLRKAEVRRGSARRVSLDSGCSILYSGGEEESSMSFQIEGKEKQTREWVVWKGGFVDSGLIVQIIAKLRTSRKEREMSKI